MYYSEFLFSSIIFKKKKTDLNLSPIFHRKRSYSQGGDSDALSNNDDDDDGDGDGDDDGDGYKSSRKRGRGGAKGRSDKSKSKTKDQEVVKDVRPVRLQINSATIRNFFCSHNIHNPYLLGN